MDALVLAAGNGDRFLTGSRGSKLACCVAGVPLIARTLHAAHRAGIRCAHVVVGYDAAHVRAVATSGAPRGLDLRFYYNARWPLENGASVLAARPSLEGKRFALLMGDHVFDWRVLRRLVEIETRDTESLVAVDAKLPDPAVAREATKVRLDNGLVVEIGKGLDTYDALDTGLFVCAPNLLDAAAESCASGDTTLSGAVRTLAVRGLVRGVDVGGAPWCDIDTPEDLAAAEALVARSPAF